MTNLLETKKKKVWIWQNNIYYIKERKKERKRENKRKKRSSKNSKEEERCIINNSIQLVLLLPKVIDLLSSSVCIVSAGLIFVLSWILVEKGILLKTLILQPVILPPVIRRRDMLRDTLLKVILHLNTLKLLLSKSNKSVCSKDGMFLIPSSLFF